MKATQHPNAEFAKKKREEDAFIKSQDVKAKLTALDMAVRLNQGTGNVEKVFEDQEVLYRKALELSGLDKRISDIKVSSSGSTEK